MIKIHFRLAISVAALMSASTALATITSKPVNNGSQGQSATATCADGKIILRKQDGRLQLEMKNFIFRDDALNGTSDDGDCHGQMSPSQMNVQCKVGDLTLQFTNAGFAGPMVQAGGSPLGQCQLSH